jgi:hypothetical protein
LQDGSFRSSASLPPEQRGQVSRRRISIDNIVDNIVDKHICDVVVVVSVDKNEEQTKITRTEKTFVDCRQFFFEANQN